MPRRTPGRDALSAGAFLSYVLATVAAVGTSLVLTHYGMGLIDQLRFVCATFGTLVLPGQVLTAWFLRRRAGLALGEQDGLREWSVLGRFGTAFVVGLGPQLAGWALAVVSGIAWLAWVPSLVVVAAGIGWNLARRRSRGSVVEHSSCPSPEAAERAPRPWWQPVVFLIAWGFLMRLLYLLIWCRTPLSGHRSWYQDLYWHVSITADALHHVPPRDPQSAADGVLSYHWFSNAHAAALTMTSGVDLDKVSVLAWYVPATLAILGLVHALAMQLSGSRAAGSVAVALLVFPPTALPLLQLDGGGTASLYWASPSQVFAVPIGLLATRVLITLLRQAATGTVNRRHVGLAVYALCLCPGAKVSQLPVLLAGLVLAGVLGLRNGWWTVRPQRRIPRVSGGMWALVILGFAGLLILLVTMPVFGGGGGGSHLSYGATVGQLSMWQQGGGDGFRNTVVMTATIVVVLMTYLPYLLVARGSEKRDPAIWFFAGAMAAALLAMVALEHPSRSQLYFVRGLVPIGVAFLAWGACRALADRPRIGVLSALVAFLIGLVWVNTAFFNQTHLIVAQWIVPLAVGSVAVGVVTTLALRNPRWRSATPVVALVGVVLGYSVSYAIADSFAVRNWNPHPVAATPTAGLNSDEIDGARALAHANPQGDLVATNVHCLGIVTTPHCDARSFWVSAFTRSPVLVGGWGYASSARVLQGVHGYDYLHQAYPFPDVIATNERFFTNPDARGAAALRRLGVRFVYADARASRISPDIARVARIVWTSGTVKVYELPPTSREGVAP